MADVQIHCDKLEQTLKTLFPKLRIFSQKSMEDDGSLTKIDAETIKTIVVLNYKGYTEKVHDGEKRQEVILKILPNNVFRIILNEAEFENGLPQGWFTKSVENTPDFDKVISTICLL